MKNCAYYAFSDKTGSAFNRCSTESDRAPIVVNCAGRMQTAFPFRTDNPQGRLDYYLMYIKSGSLTVELPSGEREIASGNAIIFPPRCHYAYSFSGNGELIYLWCHFTGSDVAALLSELGFCPLPSAFAAGHEGHISSDFERIFSVFLEDDGLRDRALGHTLEGLLISLSRAAHRGGQEKNPLARALGYINEYYTKRIAIPELAKMENLSNSRFSALFRETVGISPIRYMTKLRMQNACELLLSTDLSVKQIGLTVGYDDPHFFSKHFKAYVGISPAEYRKKGDLR